MFQNLLNLLKNITSTKKDETPNKSTYTISKDINNIGYDSYGTITQAIEATKGKKYHIYERTATATLYKGYWIDYILQKKS